MQKSKREFRIFSVDHRATLSPSIYSLLFGISFTALMYMHVEGEMASLSSRFVI